MLCAALRSDRLAVQAPVLAAVASPAALARQAVDDVRGFAVEKYGIPPDVSVVAPAAANAARVTCVPPLLLYTLAEVLKNAVTALEAQHGAWDLDEALPIVVTVRLPEASGSVSGVDRDNKAVPAPAAADFFWPTGADPTVGGAATGVGVGDGAAPSPGGSGSAGRDASGRVCTAPSMWEIEVVDYAGGMPDASLASVGRFFFSTVRASPAPGYGYSKDHGAQFAGLGVGVPMAQMYAEVMGGTLTVARHEDGHGHGTRATLQLPADGFSLRC